jgi:branched-chain amino acid transport system permease protein
VENYKESVGQVIALSDSKAAWAWTAALIVAPYWVGAYALTLMVWALIAVIGAVGLNLLTGTTGLISLGQGIPRGRRLYQCDPAHGLSSAGLGP